MDRGGGGSGSDGDGGVGGAGGLLTQSSTLSPLCCLT